MKMEKLYVKSNVKIFVVFDPKVIFAKWHLRIAHRKGFDLLSLISQMHIPIVKNLSCVNLYVRP